MNIEQFNNKIVEVGKRIFGDKYSFASSHIQSMMYGHIEDKPITYRAVIFYKPNNLSIAAESTNIYTVFDILEVRCKELHAVPSAPIELT